MKQAVVTAGGVVAVAVVVGSKLIAPPADQFSSVQVDKEYDFVVVGAGTSGSIVAARLAELKNKRVLLIEAGPDDRTNPSIQIPLASDSILNNLDYDWSYRSQPDPANEKSRIRVWPRGKVLGGSSSLNMMVFVRGNKEDYDQWEMLGCHGWSFKDVLPYFKKLEKYDGGPSGKVDGEYRGKDGPLPATTTKPLFAASKLFIDACKETGLKELEDYNGPEQIGVAYLQRNVRNGQRVNTATAYVRKSLQDGGNLTVLTAAQVTKIIIEDGVAVGVEFVRKNQPGKKEVVRAKAEVVLSAGAVGSPHLLMLSGIGNGEELSKAGVKVVKHLPGVGENLRDHLCVAEVYETYDKLALEKEDVGLKAVAMFKLFGNGPLSTAGLEALAFIKTENGLVRPDLQCHFVSALIGPDPVTGKWIDKGGVSNVFDDNHRDMPNFPTRGISMVMVLLHPESKGQLKLFSNNPADPPLIFPNYVSHPKDFDTLVKALRWQRKVILETEAFKDKIKRTVADYAIPYPFESDEYIKEFVKKSYGTLYHPVGTCKMGNPSNDHLAVVDPSLKVIGIKGLRVIDASIMPTLVSGNTNIPTAMIAEKGADLIKAEYIKSSL